MVSNYAIEPVPRSSPIYSLSIIGQQWRQAAAAAAHSKAYAASSQQIQWLFCAQNVDDLHDLRERVYAHKDQVVIRYAETFIYRVLDECLRI